VYVPLTSTTVTTTDGNGRMPLMGIKSPAVCETVPEPTESTVSRGCHTTANHFQSTVKTDAADLKQLAYVTLATLDGHTQITAQRKEIFLVLGKRNKFADYPENEQLHRR